MACRRRSADCGDDGTASVTWPGLVVVPGNWNDDLATGTLRNITRQAQLEDRP